MLLTFLLALFTSSHVQFIHTRFLYLHADEKRPVLWMYAAANAVQFWVKPGQTSDWLVDFEQCLCGGDFFFK